MSEAECSLRKALDDRIVILEGAMGTTIRGYELSEQDTRGDRFKDLKKDLKNNGDILSLTRPDVIGDIHKRFFEAGSDICETNTFSGTTIAQSEFFRADPRETGGKKDPSFYQEVVEAEDLNDLVWELNVESVRQCRKWADEVGSDQGRRCYVAGAIGPMGVGLHQMIDHDHPEFRPATFEQVVKAYAHQVRALMEAGIDLFMVETVFDALNAKAALVAIQEVFEATGKDLPIIVSAAVGRGDQPSPARLRVTRW